VELNRQRLQFKLLENGSDKHALVRFQLSGEGSTVVIRLKKDFGLSLAIELPRLGSASRGLRVLSESWNNSRTELTLDLSGLAGTLYDMRVWNPRQISAVDGAVLNKPEKLEIQMPPGPAETYVRHRVAIHFAHP
jgi:hypothetical protein